MEAETSTGWMTLVWVIQKVRELGSKSDLRGRTCNRAWENPQNSLDTSVLGWQLSQTKTSPDVHTLWHPSYYSWREVGGKKSGVCTVVSSDGFGTIVAWSCRKQTLCLPWRPSAQCQAVCEIRKLPNSSVRGDWTDDHDEHWGLANQSVLQGNGLTGKWPQCRFKWMQAFSQIQLECNLGDTFTLYTVWKGHFYLNMFDRMAEVLQNWPTMIYVQMGLLHSSFLYFKNSQSTYITYKTFARHYTFTYE